MEAETEAERGRSSYSCLIVIEQRKRPALNG